MNTVKFIEESKDLDSVGFELVSTQASKLSIPPVSEGVLLSGVEYEFNFLKIKETSSMAGPDIITFFQRRDAVFISHFEFLSLVDSHVISPPVGLPIILLNSVSLKDTQKESVLPSVLFKEKNLSAVIDSVSIEQIFTDNCYFLEILK